LLEAVRKKAHANLGRMRCQELSERGAATKFGRAGDFTRYGSYVSPDLPIAPPTSESRDGIRTSRPSR